MHWVIDTDVLVRADRFDDDHDHWSKVMRLLNTMDSLDHFLLVDQQDQIFGEYRRNLRQDSWVRKIIDKLLSRNQVFFYSGGLTANIARGLRELAFDTDDDVFVAVANRAPGGRLVAEESDYRPVVIGFLSGHGVRVMDCTAARSEIDRSSQ